MHRALPPLLLVLALLAPGLASAQATKVSVESPLMGLARPGDWVPVHVDIAATDPLDGTIRIDFGSSATPAVVRPYSVGRGSAKRISVPVQIPSWIREVNVNVTRGRSRLLAKQTLTATSGASSANNLHIALIGEDPLGFPMLRELEGVPVMGHPDCTEPRQVRVETLLPAQLPQVWFGWTSVDLVVWNRPDPARLSPEQQEALKGWVVSGGTLLVALGDTWRAWDGSPLASLSGAAPSSYGTTDTVFINLAFATGAEIPEKPPVVPVVALEPRGATARLWAEPDANVPVLVDHRVGAGRTVTMGWDPSAGELRGRLVREDVWRALLGFPGTSSLNPRPPLAGPAYLPGVADTVCDGGDYGFSDNADAQHATWLSQLWEVLSRFERANPLPLGFVLIFGFVYLLLIGPVDYFVLRKLKKPMLTWITFPALALGFSVGAAVLITFQKAGDTEVRCAEVVDVFTDQGMARGSGWCSMWSSRRQDLLVLPGRGDGVVLSGGASETEDALSGEARTVMDATRAGLGFKASQWAVANWRDGWVDPLPGGLVAQPTVNGFVVSNRTGIDLDQAWIVHRRRAWPVGSLPDGETATLSGEIVAWTPDLLQPPRAADALWTNAWFDTWRKLDDPWDEHVAALYTHHRPEPVLIGLAHGGVAAPIPDDTNFVTSAHALVRVPLPDLDPEALP